MPTIAQACIGAVRGAGAFAFATADGIDLLAGQPEFREFLAHGQFEAIIGLDAITDLRAIDALSRLRKDFPNFAVRLFLHAIPNACFHPKMIWFFEAAGSGRAVIGSGNLTRGGLRTNWEAFAREDYTADTMAALDAEWASWLLDHEAHLRPLDDPEALRRAERNGAFRRRVRQAGGPEEPPEDALLELQADLLRDRVLFAEVPRNGTRLKQVGFDLQTFTGYFGVTPDQEQYVDLQRLTETGASPPAATKAISVKSRNFRFEIEGLTGVKYPSDGRHPILVFRQMSESSFRYVLLMPDDPSYDAVQAAISAHPSAALVSARVKKRVIELVGYLEQVWPDSPLL